MCVLKTGNQLQRLIPLAVAPLASYYLLTRAQIVPRAVPMQFVEHTSNRAGQSVRALLIHGIGGHWRGTWTDQRTGSFWIDWLAAAENGLAIEFFDHPANKSDIVNVYSLDEIAAQVAAHLSRRSDVNCWIMIGHSLGGLIAKRAYLMAAEALRSPPRSHFVFLGTPHHGLDIGFGRALLRRALHRDSILRTILADRERLSQLNDAFLASAHQCRILSFYENRRWLIPELVPKETTIVGAPDETVMPLFASHSGMCKFPSKNAVGYRSVAHFVSEIVTQQSAFPVRPYSIPPGLTFRTD